MHKTNSKMNRPTSLTAPARSASNRRGGFTALEALVMLLALFILTMMLTAIWLKQGKDATKIEQPTPANTKEIIKSIKPQPDKEPPSKDSGQNALPEESEKKKSP